MIDPNLLRILVFVVVGGLIFLAFTYLISFLRPLIIAAILIIIAYLIFRFFITGTISI
ncbi:MAG: hypothetical protein AAB478_00975 [Patescibacteria group bacterium]